MLYINVRIGQVATLVLRTPGPAHAHQTQVALHHGEDDTKDTSKVPPRIDIVCGPSPRCFTVSTIGSFAFSPYNLRAKRCGHPAVGRKIFLLHTSSPKRKIFPKNSCIHTLWQFLIKVRDPDGSQRAALWSLIIIIIIIVVVVAHHSSSCG
jgi:hypothetical protein